MSTPNNEAVADLLLDWFKENGRKHLPWQHPPHDPYRTWVSEIMLQQTQVNTVIPYFKRFMQQFPTLTDLACSHEDAVLHSWSGLGYYSRARNLHKAAKQVMEQHQGSLPRTFPELTALPGIGPSTAGAILSIAYQIPTPILDGNVKRVLARLHATPGWPGNPKVAKTLWTLSAHHTPTLPERAAHYTQAIMDLGAGICTRTKPQCCICPLKGLCKAYHQSTQVNFPAKKPQKTLPTRLWVFVILKCNHHVLMIKRPGLGVWGGLWAFPEYPIQKTEPVEPTINDINQWCLMRYGSILNHTQKIASFRHTLTHFHANILAFEGSIATMDHQVMENDTHRWHKLKNALFKGGLPVPIKKLLKVSVERGIIAEAENNL